MRLRRRLTCSAKGVGRRRRGGKRGKSRGSVCEECKPQLIMGTGPQYPSVPSTPPTPTSLHHKETPRKRTWASIRPLPEYQSSGSHQPVRSLVVDSTSHRRGLDESLERSHEYTTEREADTGARFNARNARTRSQSTSLRRHEESKLTARGNRSTRRCGTGGRQLCCRWRRRWTRGERTFRSSRLVCASSINRELKSGVCHRRTPC